MAAAPYPAYGAYAVVGPVSVAPPGAMPDGGCALSGLRSIRCCRPGKRSATGRNAGWRLRLIRPTEHTLL
ncbi:hypothetical protein CEP66_24475 [Citrobacter koseri]|nr:hypothetical protein CEP66_24475 [Citrobacter koseri]